VTPYREILGIAALVALIAIPPAQAQAVRGTLVDRANGFPIGGAFVVLLDSAGHEVERALTGTAGNFLLKAPTAGTYRLQSKRIGFRVSESPELALADSQTISYRLEVQAVPARLPPVVVEGRPQCGSRGDEGTVVKELWDAAREALAEVKWSEGQRAYDFTLTMIERDFDLDGKRVVKERSSTERGSSVSPFKSVPAESLAATGYVVGGDREGRIYRAPDADVLLGDEFANTHCFSPKEGTGSEAQLVGLAFTNAPKRRLPDVRGVLWIDAASAELRFMEYQYTNLPYDLPEGPLGGRVEFMRLESGVWVVPRWQILMPILIRVVDQSGRREPQTKLTGFHEKSGIISTIRTLGGRLVYSTGSAILEGTVVDSTRNGAPLARARVWLAGTTDSTFTDSAGQFQLAVPLAGSYAVVFQHARLDSLGASLDPAAVTLTLTTRSAVTLAIPPEPRLIDRLCPAGLKEDERVIAGTVRAPDGRSPVDSAEVRLAWQEVSGGAGALQAHDWHLSTVTDGAGRYLLCGVPPARVTLTATAHGTSSREVVLGFSRDGVWIDEAKFQSLPGRIWTQGLQLKP
jgi:hypothetical protein